MSEDETKCASIIGVTEQYIHKKRFNKSNNVLLNSLFVLIRILKNFFFKTKLDEDILKRFYLTLIIYDLWKSNNSIWQVANDFQIDRGFVQQIVQSAAAFSIGVLHFCENLDEFWPYKNLLTEFCRR